MLSCINNYSCADNALHGSACHRCLGNHTHLPDIRQHVLKKLRCLRACVCQEAHHAVAAKQVPGVIRCLTLQAC